MLRGERLLRHLHDWSDVLFTQSKLSYRSFTPHASPHPAKQKGWPWRQTHRQPLILPFFIIIKSISGSWMITVQGQALSFRDTKKLKYFSKDKLWRKPLPDCFKVESETSKMINDLSKRLKGRCALRLYEMLKGEGPHRQLCTLGFVYSWWEKMLLN